MFLTWKSWTWTFSLFLHVLSVVASDAGSVFQLDFALERLPLPKHISKRDGVLGVTSNAIDDYHSITINASIGTPGQSVKLWVLTGSADTELLSFSNPECIPSCEYGTFNANASSTHVTNYSSVYNVSYADGTSAIGVYMTDRVQIGSTSISNFQFALNQNSSSKGYPANILGIGHTELEAGGTGSSYANLPLRLYNSRLTNIVGYSIWFDGPEKTSGTVAFGAIDTGRFSGVLETLPIQPSSSTSLSYTYAMVRMTSMSISKNGTVTNFTGAAIPIEIDTGSSALVVPSALFNQIIGTIGAVVDRAVGLPVIKLSEYTNDTTLMLTFGATTIRIPVNDLVTTVNNTWIAVLIAAATADSYVGIPFFRNALVVYDFSHNQISLAPSVAASTSNLTMISQNGAAGMVSTAQIAVNNTNNSTNNNTRPDTSLSQPSNGVITTSAKIGLGVGLGIPIILAIIAGALFLRKKRHGAHESSQVAEVVNVGDHHSSMYPAANRTQYTGSKNIIPSELSTSTPSTYGGSNAH